MAEVLCDALQDFKFSTPYTGQQQAYTWIWDIDWRPEGVISSRLFSALVPYLHRALDLKAVLAVSMALRARLVSVHTSPRMIILALPMQHTCDLSS